MLTVIGATLALFGALAIGDGLYIKLKAAAAQVLLRTAWERARAGATEPKPWPWADTYLVARLRVASHDVDLFVLAGANGRTLAFGPGHHDGSALPGQEGNIVLSGHRDTHFRFLRELRSGETLDLETIDGQVLRYRVQSAQVIDYRKLALPRWTAQLTLITCYPFDAMTTGGPLRYVVTAAPAAESAVR
ncbi:MAG TPA: class GN sortase [Casimicrobiaceae bacterium]|nr:class GN sortase [Casimicrobiaceae bacterium]